MTNRYTPGREGLQAAMAAGDMATYDAEHRARVQQDYHRRGICTEQEPDEMCPCGRWDEAESDRLAEDADEQADRAEAYTVKVRSWDGSAAAFEDEAAALTWSREHLRGWMEEGDQLRRFEAHDGRTVLVVYAGGEATDACVEMST